MCDSGVFRPRSVHSSKTLNTSFAFNLAQCTVVVDAIQLLSNSDNEIVESTLGPLVVKVVTATETRKQASDNEGSVHHAFKVCRSTDSEQLKVQSCITRQQSYEFLKDFNRNIEDQLHSNIINVASKVLNSTKDATIESFLNSNPQQLSDSIQRCLELMIRENHHSLSADINHQTKHFAEDIRSEVCLKFRYSNALKEEIRSAEKTGHLRKNYSNSLLWIASSEPPAIVTKSMEAIREYIVQMFSSKLIDFLKETIKRYFIKGEALNAFRAQLLEKLKSSLVDFGLRLSSIKHEKMLYEYIRNIQNNISDCIGHLELLTEIREQQLEMETVINELKGLLESLEPFMYIPLRSEKWISLVSDACLSVLVKANLGSFIIKLLPECVPKQFMEESEDIGEYVDIRKMTKSLLAIFLKSFNLCESGLIFNTSRRCEVVNVPRLFVYSVAMRIDHLMSINHQNLQPFMSVELHLNDDLFYDCSFHVFSFTCFMSLEELMCCKEKFQAYDFSDRFLWLRDVVKGLCVLHRHNITHGALGLDTVCIRNHSAQLTNPAVWPRRFGSIFEAPELQEVDDHGDLPVDILACGVLFWYLWWGIDALEKNVIAWQLPIPETPWDSELERVFFCCYEKDPSKRLTVEELSQMLEKIENSILQKTLMNRDGGNTLACQYETS